MVFPPSEDTCSTLHTVRKQVFVKYEFHYLNVGGIGTFDVYDALGCAFECISNPSCFSVNLAISKELDGKLWCKLLSSDKYRNSTEYQENMTSHHFFIMVRGTFL